MGLRGDEKSSATDARRNKRALRAAVALVLVLAMGFAAYHHWNSNENSARTSALAMMPSAASAIAFADLAALRQSPFTQELIAWAPRPQLDADYSQFLRDTGFDYERDLDRTAVAIVKHGNDSTLFVVADGRFDQKKIAAYALRTGTHETRNGKEIFSVPISATSVQPQPTTSRARRISFAFLGKDRIALTDSVPTDLGALLSWPQSSQDENDWHDRFERLGGSPIFAVFRQDASPGTALAARAPGGLQSPQLSALLDQLQWITIAGKPEGDHVRLIAEGESAQETSARQLADFLNSALNLAQAGLNGPQVRRQLDPQTRDAYLELLRTADIARLNRGDTKSVRVIVEITPKLLQAALTQPTPPPPAVSKPPSKRN